MKSILKKAFLCFVLLACLCGLGWAVWAHRRVIGALLRGEPMPDVPKSCPAFLLRGRA